MLAQSARSEPLPLGASHQLDVKASEAQRDWLPE
jgi:hypothetical protein